MTDIQTAIDGLKGYVQHKPECAAFVCSHCSWRHQGHQGPCVSWPDTEAHDFIPLACTCGLSSLLAALEEQQKVNMGWCAVCGVYWADEAGEGCSEADLHQPSVDAIGRIGACTCGLSSLFAALEGTTAQACPRCWDGHAERRRTMKEHDDQKESLSRVDGECLPQRQDPRVVPNELVSALNDALKGLGVEEPSGWCWCGHGLGDGETHEDYCTKVRDALALAEGRQP